MKYLNTAIKDDLIQACYVHEDIVFTHAGLSTTWLHNVGYSYTTARLDEFVNSLFKYKPHQFKFTRGSNHSNTGDDICQGPLWIRPFSLHNDCIDNYLQVVGHTPQTDIVFKGGTIFINSLSVRKYLLIDDNKFIVQTI